MSKHTPGPWRLEAGFLICADGIGQIANVRAAGVESESEANANAVLMLAAPDMLAALERLLSEFMFLGGNDELYAADVNLARAAIAKARGL